MLRADKVTFAYAGEAVIRDLSLAISPGSLLGIIGPNGSGKTTLLRLLAGTRRPDTGEVTLDGIPVPSLPRPTVARRLAVVPQETHLAFDYSVLEVVLMGRYAHLGAFAVEGPRDLAIARDALSATGTAQFESRAFSTLSGGEKQRVVIAAALAQIASRNTAEGRGAVLLLDEPTAALDLKYQMGIRTLLRTLHHGSGLTIVVATHDLAFAADLCGTIVMLKDGRVRASGAAGDVLTPAAIADLFGVDVAIERHDPTGQLVIVPLREHSPEHRP